MNKWLAAHRWNAAPVFGLGVISLVCSAIRHGDTLTFALTIGVMAIAVVWFVWGSLAKR